MSPCLDIADGRAQHIAAWVIGKGWYAMPGETILRRPTFRDGTRIRMADDQEWSFPDPPPPGTDVQFDALVAARREAEDCAAVLQIELAIAILLLSRNYNLKPADYWRIFDFGGDRARLSTVQAAVSAIVSTCSDRQASTPAPDTDPPTGQSDPARQRNSFLSSCAGLVKSVLGL